MRAPSARACAIASLVSAIVVTIFKLVAVFGIGIRAVANFFAVALDRIAHSSREICVFLEEFRSEAIVEAKEIGQHQYLPIAMGACAYSNRRNRDCFRHTPCELRWNELQNQ